MDEGGVRRAAESEKSLTYVQITDQYTRPSSLLALSSPAAAEQGSSSLAPGCRSGLQGEGGYGRGGSCRQQAEAEAAAMGMAAEEAARGDRSSCEEGRRWDLRLKSLVPIYLSRTSS